MLPETSDEQQSMPSYTDVKNEPVVGNHVEDFYSYDPYGQSRFLTYNYPPQQPIFSNFWQFDPTLPPALDVHNTSYPAFNPYDQQFSQLAQQPIYHNVFETSSDDTSSEASPNVSVTKQSGSPGNSSQNLQERRLERLATRNVTCSNCSTTSTTLWRKNDEGNLECNACNLYYRHKKVKRPLSLCKGKPPATRKRRPVKNAKISETD